MFELFGYALLGGIGIALLAGILGVFVIWRRMSYFGDTLSHSGLLGVALGFFLNINLNLAVTMVCILVALTLTQLRKIRGLAVDTLLGILAHATLALGLVLTAFMKGIRIDLMAYLFGDLLAINFSDLLWIWGGGAAMLLLMVLIWRPLLAITTNADLALVEGVNKDRIELIFMLMLALVIAVAMKLVGILLITALLIIPAATARRLSRSPEQMAIFSGCAGVLSVIFGFALSITYDTPSGPSIVLCCVLLFFIVTLSYAVLAPFFYKRKR